MYKVHLYYLKDNSIILHRKLIGGPLSLSQRTGKIFKSEDGIRGYFYQ